ncbi:alpha/beta hydrolase [Hymenobacter coccineus]|uniref:Serine aminopeptidase S33 domain-containing protein n=1 Tax=Hymenobacter coccineus TaxID=1908235 RepID=A0A1G1SW20_9BACT|nr:alpha/beta hydrolase [Hymenobacter coccineus]OGX82824.1 hypothetical protein BEN49_13380 [Hymenobacter coccineus]
MVRFLFLGFLFLQTWSAWAIKPFPQWLATPDSMGLKYQNLALTTPDHVRLAAWLVEPVVGAPDQHATVVVAGSDYGNMSYFLFHARALASAGYRVLLFDYRGFGHSDAFAIDHDRLYYDEFVTDLRTAFRAAQRRAPHQRVGIAGFSMGTLLGAEVAASTRCDFLITDSYFANPQAIVAIQATKFHRTTTLPAGAPHYARIAPKINCPWLLIAGTEDQQTPFADSVAAVRAARPRQRRQLLSVACGHLGAIEKLTEREFGDAYVRAITQFLAGELATVKG